MKNNIPAHKDSLHRIHRFDRIVVGGGLSGMTAAAVASENGLKTALLTKGAGTITVGSGIIDFLGCVEGKAVGNPFSAIDSLPEAHPYKIIGTDKVREAFDYFKKMTADYGYPYETCGNSNCWIPTALGTVKPTYLLPPTSNPAALFEAETITVVGIKGLKDFYPGLLTDGLRKRKAYADKEFITASLDCPYMWGRDLSALDMARYVDTAEGQGWLFSNLRPYQGSTVIIPPILGTKANTFIYDKLKEAFDIRCFETPVMPPSVPGLRLRNILMNTLKRNGVYIVDLGEVSRADANGALCRGVYTKAADGERRYEADKYIIATGGFFGGGCIAEPGSAYEAIFHIDLGAPENQMEWSQAQLLGREAHIFASMGVSVDEKFCPVNKNGDIILENVHFAGRTIGGYDFAEEKCGNGVALATGYMAGRAL